jgi:hypothetical protein
MLCPTFFLSIEWSSRDADNLHTTCLSQPHFGQVWGWSPTLGKVGSWSPPGLPNVQSSTAKGKKPRIGVFLVSLERPWNVDIENALALAIRTSAAQVMGKRRAESQTGTKSRESTFSRRPFWVCDMALERSRRGLQLWFRLRRDPTLQSGVMAVQSSGSPAGTISGLHFGSPGNLCHLDVVSMTSCREYYRE